MKIRPEILGVVDFGSSEVRVLIVCKLPGGNVQIMGHGVAWSEGCVAQGLIQDSAKAKAALKQALLEAERTARVRVPSLVAGINGRSVETQIRQGSIDIGGDPIELHNLNALISNVARESHNSGRITMANLSTREWYIDTLRVANPLGLKGKELALRIHTARIPNVIRENIKGCVEAQERELEDIAFLPIASAMGCLTSEDMALGAAVIDMGRTTTGLAIYRDYRVLRTEVFDWGAHQITRDVAAGLQITFEEAEELVTEYGVPADLIGTDADYDPIVPPVGLGEDEHAPRPVQIKLKTAVQNADDIVQREYLEHIIYERTRELFTNIRQSIMAHGHGHDLVRGIVLAGGGGLIQNNAALAEAVFNVPCRVGRPLGIEGLPQALQSPQFVGVSGLALYGLATREASYDAKRFSSNRAPTTRPGRLLAWLKRYFF